MRKARKAHADKVILDDVTLSFLLPIGYGFGAGLVPLFLGILGDHNRFALGFAVYGGLLTAASLLPFLLRLEEPGDQSSRPSSRTALRYALTASMLRLPGATG